MQNKFNVHFKTKTESEKDSYTKEETVKETKQVRTQNSTIEEKVESSLSLIIGKVHIL